MLETVILLANAAARNMRTENSVDKSEAITRQMMIALTIVHYQLARHRVPASAAQLQVSVLLSTSCAVKLRICCLVHAYGSSAARLQWSPAAFGTCNGLCSHVQVQRSMSRATQHGLCLSVAVQELLRANGGLMMTFRAFALGHSRLAMWALPCANLARDVVRLLASKPAPAYIDVVETPGVSNRLLTTAGQVRPRQISMPQSVGLHAALTLVTCWVLSFLPDLPQSLP